LSLTLPYGGVPPFSSLRIIYALFVTKLRKRSPAPSAIIPYAPGLQHRMYIR
jgi:hypothetical protein